MNKYRSVMARVGGALLLAGAFVVMSPAQADAALMVWVCNDAACDGLGPDIVVTDNGAGDATSLTDGKITVALAGGSIELASSYPFIGTANQPVLTLVYEFGSADFAAFGPTPYIYTAMDGFLLTPGIAHFEADASLGGGTGTAYAGNGAFVPGQVTDIIGGPCSIDPVECNDSGAVPGAPYYLAIGLQVTAGTGGGATGDANLTVVPEPASLALFGMGLFGVGVMSRRRLARK